MNIPQQTTIWWYTEKKQQKARKYVNKSVGKRTQKKPEDPEQ